MGPERLSARSLERLAEDIARPGYDRDAAGVGIVHLGVGAFMRAHTAVYCDDAMATNGGDWRIGGVSLRSGAVRDLLEPQDCLYTVCVSDDRNESRRVIGAIESMSVAPESPQRVVGLLAEPNIKIVTLTITEKGYCLDPGSGMLDPGNAAIRHDLAHPDAPKSAIGFLVAALKLRFATGSAPLTLVSCDNLPGNGRRLHAAVVAFAAQHDADLAGRIEDEIAFPETMVDRIVPATVDADIEEGIRATGLRDDALVRTEPFRQWVIEDRFASGRPAWEAGGALLVPDVEPYESAKLRLLNGAHSSIAWLGYLAGFRCVHEVMRNTAMAAFVRYLMTVEISPVTPEPAGMTHVDYIDSLLKRFTNPSLGHRTWQIAMDSSQKLPQRLLMTLRLQLDRSGPIDGLCLAIAGWMRFALGRDDAGNPIEISDPLRERFSAIAIGGSDTGYVADAFLSLAEIFGTDLREDRRVRETIIGHLDRLAAAGARAAVRHFVAVGERS